MDYISGFTFGFMGTTGDLRKESAKISLKKLIEETAVDTITLPLIAIQDTTNTTEVFLENKFMYERDEYIEFVKYAKSLGLKVIVKSMVEVRNGMWRGLINFIEPSIVCEAKWEDWFRSYTDFTNYCAEIAQEAGAYMYCVGCEMVCSNSQEQLWRNLISEARQRFDGLITYNCDKYQEDHVKFWDALDVISSSGYYPLKDIPTQLNRIKGVVEEFDKPFMFMECGCPSRKGSETNPNNWQHVGETDVEVQNLWISTFIDECEKTNFVQGYTWWDWKIDLYTKEQGMDDDGYNVYGKPSSKKIKETYLKHQGE